MKKSIALLTVLVGLTMSSFTTDSPISRERKKGKKAKSSCCTEMSKSEGQAACSAEAKKACEKK